MWHVVVTLPCALLAPASLTRSDQRRLLTRASYVQRQLPPVPVPVWSEPLVRLLTADAGRLRDQLECDDQCQITCVARWTSTRTPLARWAADRSLCSLQRHWDDAVGSVEWLQVTTLQRHFADAVDWMQLLPALAAAGILSDGEGSRSSSSSRSCSSSSSTSSRWNLRQIGVRFVSASKRSASLLLGFWSRRHLSQPPAATYTMPQLANAIEPLHAEIRSAVAVTLGHSPLVVLGLGLRLLTFLFVSQLGDKLHAQRMLPRLLDDAATALESSRLAETRRLAASPSRGGGPPPAAVERRGAKASAPAPTRELLATTPADADWIGAIQLIGSD